MKKTKVFMAVAACCTAVVMGLTGLAYANPERHGMAHPGYTQEQQDVAQELRNEYGKIVAPLQQKMKAKRAELEVLYYSENTDTAKVQAVFKEIAELEAKIFMADAALRTQMTSKGLSNYGCGPMGSGMSGSGMGRGTGCGMMGSDMHGGSGMQGKGMRRGCCS